MNKKELLEEIVKLDIEVSENFPHYDLVNKEVVLALIDQLDEPEVLSKKWIDEHEIHYNHWVGAVPVTDLQNLLVPKQKLPVVPQFVAEWIEEAKDRKLTLYGSICDCPREVDYWLVDGDSSNQETFARAWLDGYEIEVEKRWVVKGPELYLIKKESKRKRFLLNLAFLGGKLKTNYTYSIENALSFVDEEKANTIATWIDGEVEEVDNVL